MYEGMYLVEYVGREGFGLAVLVFEAGYIFGHDGQVHYDGTYEPSRSDPIRIDLDLTLTVPPGAALVQGVPPQPAEYRFSIRATIPAQGGTNLRVETPYGPVACNIRYLRPIPRQLAA